MASSHVQIAPDSTGKDIGTVRLTSDEAGTPAIERQEVVVASPTTFANRQEVDSSGNAQVKVNAALPAGSNAIGSVSVSNLPGTQPVSGTVAVSSLPGSPAQDGTDATGVTAPTGGVGIRGWLSGIYQRLGGTLATSRTWTLGSGTDSVDIGNFPATQPISGAVSVSNLPATQPVSGTVTSNAGSGTFATSVADGSDTALGTTTDLATANTLIGRVKQLLTRIPTALGQQTSAASLGVVVASDQSAIPVSGTVTANVGTGTQPVSGTVTANAGSGTLATSVADGADTALGSTGDASSGNTAIALLKNIKAALAGTLTISGAVTNSNLDVALSTRLKPADTLAGVTTVAAVTAITNPLPAGTNTIGAVKQATQASLTAALCSALTGTGAQAGQSLDGYDGAGTLQITAVGTVGAQAVSLQIEGSIDNSNWGIIGTAQIDATANPSYAAASFTLTPGASTISHLYAVRDTVKFLRVNVTANNLGTGLTISYYSNPV